MTSWEYTWLRVPTYNGADDDTLPGQYDLDSLDSMGLMGWEAYAISEHLDAMVVHLKRPMVTGGTEP